MIRLRLPIFLLLTAVLACSGPSLAELAVGQQAPDFTLPDLDGQPVALASLRGRTVVLEWMNPNCPVSRRHAEQGTMQGLHERYPQVVWLAINSTRADHGDYVAPAAYKRYDSEHGITYTVLYDTSGEVGRAYGAKTTPHMFVIDGDGRLVYMGAIDDDPHGRGPKTNYVASALDALARGDKPEPAVTRPYGCSVKY